MLLEYKHGKLETEDMVSTGSQGWNHVHACRPNKIPQTAFKAMACIRLQDWSYIIHGKLGGQYESKNYGRDQISEFSPPNCIYIYILSKYTYVSSRPWRNQCHLAMVMGKYISEWNFKAIKRSMS